MAHVRETLTDQGTTAAAPPSSTPKAQARHAHESVIRNTVAVAAWFGIVAGLLEGSALLLFEKFGWMTWNMGLLGVDANIIWICAALDVVLFAVVGLVIAGSAKLFRRISPETVLSVTIFTLATFAFLDWILLVDRIRHSAALILALGLGSVLTRAVSGSRRVIANRFFRRTLPYAAAIALILFVGIRVGSWAKERLTLARLPEAGRNPPNILLIVVDSLRADHLSSYGYSRLTSPNLDALARGGVLFENAIATSTWTLPSHASILTGRYPHEHGAERDVYDQRFPSLASVLQGAGYRTAAFSANTQFFTRARGFGAGFIRFEDYYQTFADAVFRTIAGRELYRLVLRWHGHEDYPGREWSNEINADLLRWVKGSSKHPFFVFVNYYDVHEPYVPPQPFRGKFSASANPGGIVNGWMGRVGPLNLTGAQVQAEIDAYDGGIALADSRLGELLAQLKGAGLLENTVVLVTSDHGEQFGEHGEFGHRQAPHRELIHVPLVLSWPGHIPAGARVPAAISIADIPCTLIQLAELPRTPFSCDSFAPLWQSSAVRNNYALTDGARFNIRGERTETWRSLTSSSWHLIVSDKAATELYDWANDSAEKHNLAATPGGQAIGKELMKRLPAVLANHHGHEAASEPSHSSAP